ncbi:hypothetical protein ElyMa_000183900 [Elysia marginata]|uniref:Uncharacterized protein n=1 Tax=Elysia marginata TaxID=1093978 RepID=A0AAV4EVK2_9GAST|nr:hypothetical protein ElyMa_000183900 [Elysia marginata]
MPLWSCSPNRRREDSMAHTIQLADPIGARVPLSGVAPAQQPWGWLSASPCWARWWVGRPGCRNKEQHMDNSNKSQEVKRSRTAGGTKRGIENIFSVLPSYKRYI